MWHQPVSLAFSWHVQDPGLLTGSDGGQKSTELTCELKRTEAVPRRVQGLWPDSRQGPCTQKQGSVPCPAGLDNHRKHQLRTRAQGLISHCHRDLWRPRRQFATQLSLLFSWEHLESLAFKIIILPYTEKYILILHAKLWLLRCKRDLSSP